MDYQFDLRCEDTELSIDGVYVGLIDLTATIRVSGDDDWEVYTWQRSAVADEPAIDLFEKGRTDPFWRKVWEACRRIETDAWFIDYVLRKIDEEDESRGIVRGDPNAEHRLGKHEYGLTR